ncbi:TNFAIP3-interacting protein 2-like [Gigantopelta aegis]|uniref:TNFAIP3-interacting protein 2-like n=1 Tax=Gigantopelta aegis TaxID=1735272 RepID=UPI001B8873C1|nr:TNFAIP3-interacting protein 2-like [Gigantopelta aegis]
MDIQPKTDPNDESHFTSPNVMETIKLERDAYKEKLDHMKVFINELKRELQSQRIRNEGVETVSKLLSESRQEILTLQRQKKTLETLIRNLQNRLAINGLSNSVTFGENELFIPGISKQILDNLAKENARLRNMIGTPSDVGGFKSNSMLQEIVDKLTTENANLQGEIDSVQKKVVEFENTLHSSSSDKDKEIANLRDCIKRVQKDSQLQNVLCHSMSGEIGSLRGKLHNFVVDCQTLEMRLEESEKKIKKQEEPVSEENLPTTVTLQQASEENQDLTTIKEENQKLHEKLQEVIEMNNRWQDYNSAREKYVQSLHNKIADLEQRLKSMPQSETQQKMDGLLRCATEKLQKEAETIEKLKAELEQSRAEKQRLQTMVVTSDDAATIEALKAQIQICTEDFETERQDREKAQNIIGQLQSELNKLKKEKQQQQHLMQYQNRDFSNIPAPKTYLRPTYPTLRPDVSLQSRGISADGNVPDGLRSDGPEPEGMGPVSLPVTKSPCFFGQGLAVRKKSDDLCCPKCSLGFSEAEQDKLLEHMEECCE